MDTMKATLTVNAPLPNGRITAATHVELHIPDPASALAVPDGAAGYVSQVFVEAKGTGTSRVVEFTKFGVPGKEFPTPMKNFDELLPDARETRLILGRKSKSTGEPQTAELVLSSTAVERIQEALQARSVRWE